MSGVRLRYPPDVADGRLCTVRGGAAAACQLLGMVRDLAPGDFPGLPQLYNPCDRVEARDRAELLPELRTHLQAFFDGLPGAGVGVAAESAGSGRDLIGIVTLTGPGWRLRMPVREGGQRVVLDLDAFEED